ncbi:MAG: 1-deoxy-D-xylulose-5-phosphate synthase, partial [Thermoplasmata archaeon]|nr:1-deoxy-D-xylulose-5-phosphate synthase [Thermoplasmata archaeon]
FLVILNDNEMSISRNVGGLAASLNRLITTPLYEKIVHDADHILQKIPSLGPRMIKTRQKLLESVKGLVVPGAMFEEMGFRYFGPVNAHDIHSLLHMLKHIKTVEQPVLLHVVSKKGKGFEPAEDHPEKFHSAPKFDIMTGEPISSTEAPCYSRVFGDSLVRLARKDESVVAITAAMALGTGLDKFRQEFPHRFFDVGIAEQHAVSLAGGLAISGYRPVVAIYSTFLQRAYDQILHDICLQKLPVVFAIDRAGLVGEDGPTHHGVFDIAMLSMMPDMTVLAPSDGSELIAMLDFALGYDGPVAIRYPKTSCESAADPPRTTIEYAKAEVIRDGRDVAIFAVGVMAQSALEAARTLEIDGISAMVVNLRFLKPLDEKLIKKLAETIPC